MYAKPWHKHVDVCQSLAYVMSHDHWSVARKTTWQHVFTGLPPIIYYINMGQHLGHHSRTEVCNVT